MGATGHPEQSHSLISSVWSRGYDHVLWDQNVSLTFVPLPYNYAVK